MIARAPFGGPAGSAQPFPWATLALALAALAAWCVPGATAALELDRALVGHEAWRLVGGHLTHFTVEHLVWDLVVLIGLGGFCEWRWPWRTRAALALAGPVLGLAFLVGCPGLATYRGLSGLDSVLMLLLAAGLFREGALGPRTRWLPLVAGLAFLAKVTLEAVTGATAFVDARGVFEPVPLIHLAGGLLGLASGLFGRA